MSAKVKPVPDKYHSITPYLIVEGAAAAIDFYKQAFGALELFRMPQAGGRIGHAELKIGDQSSCWLMSIRKCRSSVQRL